MPPPRSAKIIKQREQSFDDTFSLAVKTEESAEKWVTRDEPKAQRFFIQAIELYQKCCKLLPLDFDSLYNLARAHFGLSQLKLNSPEEQSGILESAIYLHRAAIKLQEHTDAVFNLAGCLSSLAEAVEECGDFSRSRALLLESISLLEKCLFMQEKEINSRSITADQSEDDVQIAGDHDGGDEKMELEQTATIIEPITSDALLDTILALVESRCRLLTLNHRTNRLDSQDLQYPDLTLLNKVEILSQETSRTDEYHLARAELLSYRTLLQLYSQQGTLEVVDQAIKLFDLPHNSVPAQCNKADFLVDLSNYLASNGSPAKSWTYLAAAATSLKFATASKPTIFALWETSGNVELLRARLAIEASTRNITTLLKNAKVFFQYAIDHCKVERLSTNLKVKLAMILVELADPKSMEILSGFSQNKSLLERIVLDSIQEGLFPADMYNTFMA
ncbi:UPF0656 protein [Neolecta irregularis DAH-3]|uniref:UPF0656 protein n=1 Tax=Neolecta irregularis (strain DAH-3) TaxID=1198029 RepID=A0A1U7LI36_NEOID|nr:UPF0656 protein [Neolecta irregularis DAH-3]|eukprot:OLL22191.1 UPF0656 protein [Neolecta irregularis DAH-3]